MSSQSRTSNQPRTADTTTDQAAATAALASLANPRRIRWTSLQESTTSGR